MIIHYSYHKYQTACNGFRKQVVLHGSSCSGACGDTFELGLQITHLTYRQYWEGTSFLVSMQINNLCVSILSVRLHKEVILIE